MLLLPPYGDLLTRPRMRVSGRFRGHRFVTSPGMALGVLLVLSAGVPADGATVPSPEGAGEIQDSIEAYFGKAVFERGALVIRQKGDGYDFVFHPGKSSAQPPSHESLEEALTFHVTPQDDGTYAFRSEAAEVPDLDASAGPTPFENCEAHGIFDAKARFFASLSAGCDHIALKSSQADDPFQFATGKLSLELSGKPAADGASDIRLALDAPDISATLPDKTTPGSKPVGRISIGSIHYEIDLNALRYGALLDLYRLALRLDTPNGSRPAAPILRAGFKAVRPVWDDIEVQATVDDLHAEIAGMTFQVGRYDEKQDLSGLIVEGHYDGSIALKDVSARRGSDPHFFETLLPSRLGLRLALTGADFEQVANAMLDHLVSPGAGLETALARLQIDGKARLSADADVTARDYAVTGKTDVPIDMSMRGSGAFSASGYDAIAAAVGKLKSDDVAGYALILAFLKGLAKGAPDGRLNWDVALDLLARQITVNGQVFDLR
jgi:hypothetical protein